MSEIIFYYIIPNFLLFGSICVFSKYYEKLTWALILSMTSDTKKENIIYKKLLKLANI